MAEEYYRFWSLDPLYRKITKLIQKKGTRCPIYGEIHRDMRLFEGDVYEFGKALGKKYPEGSIVLCPNLTGKEEKPTTSFPATLLIICETRERLSELEKKFGLDSIPKNRREILHPQSKEEWAPSL